jgi:opacity protein-like surface antigen
LTLITQKEDAMSRCVIGCIFSVTALSLSSIVAIPTDTPAQTTQNPPTLEEQRQQEAEARQARREREADRRYDDRDRDRGEMYVAGFGGYTIGHGFNDVEGTGLASGVNFGDFGLKNSAVYGGKVGYFLPRRLSWLGFEVEAFNTTPHIEQSTVAGIAVPGSHLRVTTLAFNAIARAKMMCERHDDHDRSRRTATTDSDYRDHDFCRLQPYAGVGLGVFFARASDAAGSASDNGVPGLNVLAGLRYFVTERVAVFGEYKYNRATFDFDNVGATGVGLKGDYSASHVVGGLSLHF